MMQIEQRIECIDGLRGIAILSVVGYHYFSQFARTIPGLYPYGELLADVQVFRYGFYGVHLFFAISGFVIALSLERSRSFIDFAVKRFARLWPTMLLCSTITFSVLSIWPTFMPQRWVNFLPSLSFIEPMVWNRLIPTLGSEWIDGAYWSLFVEIRFYFLAALFYFISSRRFFLTTAIFSTTSVCAHVYFSRLEQIYFADLFNMIAIAKHWPWFLLGIAARHLFISNNNYAAALGALAGSQLLLLISIGLPKTDLAIFIVIAGLFLIAARSASLRTVLEVRWLVAVGVTSYSLYLLHENVGLTMISIFSQSIGFSGPASLVVAVAVLLMMIFISRLIYQYWESPINRWFVGRLKSWQRNRATPVNPTATAVDPL